MILKGVYTALITPFKPNGAIDEEGFRRNIRFQLNSGIDGFVLLGTTAEAPTLTEKECDLLFDILLAENRGKLPIIVGTGDYSTQTTIEKTLWAEKRGAQAALIIAPYYNRPTQEGIVRHFQAIAAATKLPLIAYNQPNRTGVNITPATAKRLADIPTVIGLKTCVNHNDYLSEILASTGYGEGRFRIVSGDDTNVLPILSIGCSGVISVVTNLVPAPMVQLVRAALNRDFKTAKRLHYQLFPIVNALGLESNPIPIKEAMNLCKMPAGDLRLPLVGMSPENRKLLRQVLMQYRLIPTASTLEKGGPRWRESKSVCLVLQE